MFQFFTSTVKASFSFFVKVLVKCKDVAPYFISLNRDIIFFFRFYLECEHCQHLHQRIVRLLRTAIHQSIDRVI